ncbi:MAG: class I SAM-dependent methyltransferase [Actinobacteria bacterium]|nr:class I SAM-dependent methyltransferase [Actinomycetota bacterium]
MSNNKAAWDDFWRKSDGFRHEDVYSLINKAKFDYLKSLIPPKGRSLEVGAGEAHLSAYLAKIGYETTALDYSEEALKLAETNFERQGVTGNFVVGDAFGLPFEDRSFDLVFSTGLLEHYEDPSPIVREMVRLVEPGGLFFSDIVPDKFSLLRAFKSWRRQPDGMDGFYERGFRKEEIEKILADARLHEVEVIPAGVYPPELPLLHRSATYRRLEHAFLTFTGPFWKRLDRTMIAEWLGFYYLAHGVK